MASAWSQDRNYFKKLYRIQQVYNDEMLLSFPFDIYFFSLSHSVYIYQSGVPVNFYIPFVSFSVSMSFLSCLSFYILYPSVSLCVQSFTLSLSLSLSLSLCLSSISLFLPLLYLYLSSISLFLSLSLSLVVCDNVLTGSMKEAV